jgi:hypothetical protein
VSDGVVEVRKAAVVVFESMATLVVGTFLKSEARDKIGRLLEEL